MAINHVRPLIRVALLLHIFLIAPTPTRADRETRIVCYFTNWTPQRSGEYAFDISDIPVDLCTHVSYTFAAVDEYTFELKSTIPSFDILQKGYSRFSQLKDKHPNLKLSLSVGGWAHGGEAFQKMASSFTYREIFIASVIEFMRRYNFDGVEMVWLWPGSPDRGGTPADKDNYHSLISELKEGFRREGHESWEVYVQVPVDRYRLGLGYHQKQLCNAADYVYITGYDFRGTWNEKTDVHSAMNNRHFDSGALRDVNVRGGLQDWMNNGCPANKIVLGVPLFGRTFTLQDSSNHGLAAPITGPGNPGPHTKEGGYMGYFEICNELKQPGWTIEWDERGVCPYAYRGDQWIGYENQTSLEEKASFAKYFHLGGMYAFALDLDDYRGKCGAPYPLLNALRHAFKPKRVCSPNTIGTAFDREPCDLT